MIEKGAVSAALHLKIWPLKKNEFLIWLVSNTTDKQPGVFYKLLYEPEYMIILFVFFGNNIKGGRTVIGV